MASEELQKELHLAIPIKCNLFYRKTLKYQPLALKRELNSLRFKLLTQLLLVNHSSSTIAHQHKTENVSQG
jgi:hypothetical protein